MRNPCRQVETGSMAGWGRGGGVYHLLCQEAEQEVQFKVFACKTGSKIQEESRMANYETQITHETWLKI